MPKEKKIKRNVLKRKLKWTKVRRYKFNKKTEPPAAVVHDVLKLQTPLEVAKLALANHLSDDDPAHVVDLILLAMKSNVVELSPIKNNILDDKSDDENVPVFAAFNHLECISTDEDPVEIRLPTNAKTVAVQTFEGRFKTNKLGANMLFIPPVPREFKVAQRKFEKSRLKQEAAAANRFLPNNIITPLVAPQRSNIAKEARYKVLSTTKSLPAIPLSEGAKEARYKVINITKSLPAIPLIEDAKKLKQYKIPLTKRIQTATELVKHAPRTVEAPVRSLKLKLSSLKEKEKPKAALNISESRVQTHIDVLIYGDQCSNCSVRHNPKDTLQYSRHLDWHFYQNRKATLKNSYPWYDSVSKWIHHDEFEHVGEKQLSYFETQQLLIESSQPKELSLPSCAASITQFNEKCQACFETLTRFFNDELDEWRLQNTIRVDGKLFHPSCFEDWKPSSMSADDRNSFDVPLEDDFTILPDELTEPTNPSAFATPPAVIINLDGNIQVQDILKLPLKKIKFNMVTNMASNESRLPSEEKPNVKVEQNKEQEEIIFDYKPTMKNVYFKQMPPFQCANETSALCRIM